MNCSRPMNRFNPTPMLVLALLIAGVWLAITYGEHAVEKHSTSAEQVRECIENKGWLLDMFNPTTKRHARICQLPTGQYGVQICDEKVSCEITSFVKDRMRRLEQVIKYLANVGYK